MNNATIINQLEGAKLAIAVNVNGVNYAAVARKVEEGVSLRFTYSQDQLLDGFKKNQHESFGDAEWLLLDNTTLVERIENGEIPRFREITRDVVLSKEEFAALNVTNFGEHKVARFSRNAFANVVEWRNATANVWAEAHAIQVFGNFYQK